MEETKRNSMKLDIEAVRVSDNDRDQPTESYKQISEFDNNDKSTGEFIHSIALHIYSVSRARWFWIKK